MIVLQKKRKKEMKEKEGEQMIIIMIRFVKKKLRNKIIYIKNVFCADC